MKAFNPDKELKKSKINKRNIIIECLMLLIPLVVGYSFATYSLGNQSYSIMDSVVGEFTKGDIVLKVLVDGEKQSSFPSTDSGKGYLGVSCQNGGVATWNNTNRNLLLTLLGNDICDVIFGNTVAVLEITNLLELYKEGNTAGNPVMMANDDPDGNVRYIRVERVIAGEIMKVQHAIFQVMD